MIVIGISQADPYEGCFITFQQPFSVCLRGKLIQVKTYIYELMDVDHFTFEKSIDFESEKNVE